MSLDRPVAPNPYEQLPRVGSFAVASTDITDGQPIADRFVADGGNVSPQLSWSGFPDGTKSFVVNLFDPDAPTPSGFWHWAVAGIPVGVTTLGQGAGAESSEAKSSGAESSSSPPSSSLPTGAFQLRNDAGVSGYSGPQPPPGDRPHRYFLVVHAVDVDALEVDESASMAYLAFQLAFHTLARGILVGTYQVPAPR